VGGQRLAPLELTLRVKLRQRLVQLEDDMQLLPRKPHCSPSVSVVISFRSTAGAIPVALDTIGIWTTASWGVMSGVPAPRGGHQIRGRVYSEPVPILHECFGVIEQHTRARA
jgi:hypothetical protein